MNIQEIVNRSIEENKFIYGVFTTPKNKSDNPYKKITARPINAKNKSIIQFEKFTDKQAFHENYSYEEANEEIINLIIDGYKNINLYTSEADYQIIVSKKGSVKVTEKQPSKKQTTEEHNKKKQYIINENEPCDFLELLGVMNKQGMVYSKKYDKFKQINKFLEIVDDSLKGRELRDDFMIIDFGCGKAYLTFALYYYFYHLRQVKVKIIGLDLKEEVINYCNEISNKLNYDNLKFVYGDIRSFDYENKIDMIVTLHACDTATDASLVKAIKWNADIILSVPCCQHEFYDKIKNTELEPMLKHGLIKERVSSLVTDSLRGLFMETKGYKVQLMEFIAMEHTPKNILIRAVKTGKENKNAEQDYNNFKKFWHLEDLFIENYYYKQ
ncbi:SAM-dependent methyltransferase [Sedimentibacter hydroxybenzoicus DSM 7310]|uniref:SAM-dependent methyltransferase n=1 Tax=Sedimentibacter hydroxybenzoicus DSM 7310 TaxID=1123245 RepID=A0A974BGH9_SEDHY|nr:SAM-dependent methyltransferase [Sedimentibacter hydroxybenzoicus]NYB72678.1 SAM-dependent methyltransferase [Sedimentibacter hydroxybenzoicus DSM 7310]